MTKMCACGDLDTKGSASGGLYRTSILSREVKGKVNIFKNGRPEVVLMISAGRTVSP